MKKKCQNCKYYVYENCINRNIKNYFRLLFKCITCKLSKNLKNYEYFSNQKCKYRLD